MVNDLPPSVPVTGGALDPEEPPDDEVPDDPPEDPPEDEPPDEEPPEDELDDPLVPDVVDEHATAATSTPEQKRMNGVRESIATE